MLHSFNNDIFSIIINFLNKDDIINLQYVSLVVLNKLKNMYPNIWKLLIFRDFKKYVFDENENQIWLVNGIFKEYLLNENELQLWSMESYREFYWLVKKWRFRLKLESKYDYGFGDEYKNYKINFDTRENFSIYITTKQNNLNKSKLFFDYIPNNLNIFKLYFNFKSIDTFLNNKLNEHTPITLEHFAWQNFSKTKYLKYIYEHLNDTIFNILKDNIELIREVPKYIIKRCYWGTKKKIYDYYFTIKNDDNLYVIQTNVQLGNSGRHGDKWKIKEYDRRFYRTKKMHVQNIMELMINSHVVNEFGHEHYYFEENNMVLGEVMDIRLMDLEEEYMLDEGFDDRQQRLDFSLDIIPIEHEILPLSIEFDINLPCYEQIAHVLSQAPYQKFTNNRNY